LQQLTIPLFKVFMADSVKAAVTRVLYSGYIGEGEEDEQPREADSAEPALPGSTH
jgi:hypothetical protein